MKSLWTERVLEACGLIFMQCLYAAILKDKKKNLKVPNKTNRVCRAFAKFWLMLRMQTISSTLLSSLITLLLFTTVASPGGSLVLNNKGRNSASQGKSEGVPYLGLGSLNTITFLIAAPYRSIVCGGQFNCPLSERPNLYTATLEQFTLQ